MRKRKPRRRWFSSHTNQRIGRRELLSRWAFPIVAVGLAGLVSVALLVCVARFSREQSSLTTVEVLRGRGDVRVAASVFQDGQARFYRYNTTSGVDVRFFIVKTSDGVIRAAFDSCESCRRSRRGYRQAGNMLVCNACGRRFASTDINIVQGGCAPARLEHAVEGDQIVLQASSLERGAAFF